MSALRSARGIALLLLILPPFFAQARSLPEWAGKIKVNAPAVDEECTDEEFRVLWMERQVTVEPDGKLKVRDRIAKQALSDHADEVGVEGFFLGPGATMRSSRAWHSLPGGKTTRSRRSDAFDLSGFDSFLTDRTVRSVAVEGIRRGSIVFFEFQGDWVPYLLGMAHTFATSTVVDVSRFSVDLPEGWKLHWDWLHGPGVEPTVSGNSYTFEFNGLNYPYEEDLALSVADRAPLLYLTFEPPSDVGIPYVGTWSELGQWVTELNEKPGTLTAEIEAAAKQAAGEQTALGVIVGCGKYVRDKVRYIAKAIGIGGYRPRYADETLRQLWGDCKDKATLLQAMLKSQSLTSYPVLVSLLADETVSEKIPSLSAFDHMVLAVRVPEQMAGADRLRHAIFDDPQFGPLLLVDTTDEFTSLGWMSGSLSGRRGLLVAGEKSHLITLPGAEPEAHRREREMTIRVAPDHSAEMVLTTRRYGEMAWHYRRDHASSQKEAREDLEKVVHSVWTDAQVEEVTIIPEQEDGAYVSTVRWSVDALPEGSKGYWISPFQRAVWALASIPTRRRRTPVVYEFPREISTSVTIEGIPEQVSLPKDKTRQGEGWSVTRSMAREGAVVEARWSLRLEKVRFEVDELESLKSLYRALRSVGNTRIAIP